MTVNKVWFIALILASSILGIVVTAINGTAPTFGNLLGRSMGAALVPAILPLIWLLFQRFDLTHASRPLWTWSILLLVFSVLSYSTFEVEKGIKNSNIVICHPGSEWCVTFPGKISVNVVDDLFLGKMHRYEFHNNDIFLRAQFTDGSLFTDLANFDDNRLREVGNFFVQQEKLTSPQIFVEEDSVGRVLNVWGDKDFTGRKLRVFSKTYFGKTGYIELSAVELAQTPSVTTSTFFGSIIKR